MIKVIVFDFDGVIVDSNRFKREAWFNVFPPHEEVPEGVIRDVLARISQTRYDIIRAVFTALGRSPENVEAGVAKYAGVYNEIVQSGLAKIGLIPGALDALAGYAKKYRLYINSATPTDALQETCRTLGIAPFFEWIYGAPSHKEDHLRSIMAQELISGEELLMVGDGEGDRSAAALCQCYFIGIANESNKWRDESFPLITHMSEISGRIETGEMG